jgi:hypothetical protein
VGAVKDTMAPSSSSKGSKPKAASSSSKPLHAFFRPARSTESGDEASSVKDTDLTVDDSPNNEALPAVTPSTTFDLTQSPIAAKPARNLFPLFSKSNTKQEKSENKTPEQLIPSESNLSAVKKKSNSKPEEGIAFVESTHTAINDATPPSSSAAKSTKTEKEVVAVDLATSPVKPSQIVISLDEQNSALNAESDLEPECPPTPEEESIGKHLLTITLRVNG